MECLTRRDLEEIGAEISQVNLLQNHWQLIDPTPRRCNDPQTIHRRVGSPREICVVVLSHLFEFFLSYVVNGFCPTYGLGPSGP